MFNYVYKCALDKNSIITLILPTNDIRAIITFLDECLDASGLELCQPFTTLDVKHSWNVENLTSESEFGQCEETHK
jgi:hypothetical protein